jgi:predicted Ser/Thr protein kinase
MTWDVKFTGILKEDGALVYVIFGIEDVEQPDEAARRARALLDEQDTWYDDDDEPVQFTAEEVDAAEGMQGLIDIDPVVVVSRTISFQVTFPS